MKRLLVILICVTPLIKCSQSDSNILKVYKVLPQETDATIAQTNKPHYAFVKEGGGNKGKLMLFIGGTDSAPSQYQQFSKQAAGFGYHVIDLNYIDTVSTLVCQKEVDAECFTKFHDEIIFGGDVSPYVEVDENNSVVDRTLKLLQYLHAHYPHDGWNQFYDQNDLVYSKFVVAGHSQGGGHAAYLAYKFEVDRLIVFCSPSDYSEKYASPANWCSETFATSSNNFYGLMHQHDNVVKPNEVYGVWSAMKLLDSSDTLSVDKPGYQNSHALVINIAPNPSAYPQSNHNAPIIDAAIPLGSDGSHLKEVWNFLLGEQ